MKLCKNCDHYEVLLGGRSACTRMGSQEQCPVTGYDKIGGMLNPYQERSESGGCGPDGKHFVRRRSFLARLFGG